MKKLIISILLVSGCVASAEVKIDYTLRLFKQNQARIVRQLAVVGQPLNLVGSLLALPTGGTDTVSHTVSSLTSGLNGLPVSPDVVTNSVAPQVENVASQVTANAQNPTAAVSQVKGLIGNIAGGVLSDANGIANPANVSAVTNNPTGFASGVTSNPTGVLGGVFTDASGVLQLSSTDVLSGPASDVNSVLQAASMILESINPATNKSLSPNAVAVPSLNDPMALIQEVQDLVVGIDVINQSENAVELLFTVAQKQLNGSLIPVAQIPVVAQFNKEEVVELASDDVNSVVQSLSLSLLATPVSNLE